MTWFVERVPQCAEDLFGIPVIDTDEHDDYDVRYVVCNLDKTPGRLELLKHASMIIWDESLSNHMHCLDASARLLKTSKT